MDYSCQNLLEKQVDYRGILGYTIGKNCKYVPGVYESPSILNLHLLSWDSYIAQPMSGLRLQWKTDTCAAVTHLA